ncbi:MAG: type-F conjugative transfer system pilin assembly protein TrbC [Alphaproteobacteria bacterium 16-39-46]|nr:MAG: type-F conjugative transfer system pilin assembly protein TrbC [Alphaproteobacteria bacterium 16-39-46]OZA41832.1 MAG: type-F conjugative transfer system pilin assembly protein TrbC [Alphaproteobacteria bacterium 17-39-52]HQS84686.1 type-F conjugative transfer system pilin assembly protein TrbC [Alphaproteobacteria bacterium]HQS93105.1 type-F conjugative transfer system pilin assembly protein TrbC [Alphaproteobacteria bacterium]HQS93762.1 type-F conjugative transfer system pilin assembl
MLFIMKTFLILCLGANVALAGACCPSCQQGHVCESQKKEMLQSRYPELLVFVSFSMPIETLKVLAMQVNAIGGAIVFRGLEHGSFKNAAIKLKELGQESLIDPTLFEAYGVTDVPTFILREKTTEEANTKVLQDRLSGNVSLTHVLEQFSEQGDVQEVAQSLLKKLREKACGGK